MRRERFLRRLGFRDLVPCIMCGQPVTRYSLTCPACGAAQPAKSLGGLVGIGGVIILILVLVAYGFATGWGQNGEP